MFHTAVCAHLDLRPSAQIDYRGLIVYGEKTMLVHLLPILPANKPNFFGLFSSSPTWIYKSTRQQLEMNVVQKKQMQHDCNNDPWTSFWSGLLKILGWTRLGTNPFEI